MSQIAAPFEEVVASLIEEEGAIDCQLDYMLDGRGNMITITLVKKHVDGANGPNEGLCFQFQLNADGAVTETTLYSYPSSGGELDGAKRIVVSNEGGVSSPHP